MQLNKKAFTLIELIITIAIIALIASAVFVAVDPAKRLGETKDSQRLTDLTAIKKAVNLYTADNGSMPSDIDTTSIKKGDKIVLCSSASELTCDGQTHDCMVIDDTSFLGPYLTTLPIDPDESDTADTGYYITRNADRTITFGACNSYGSGASLTVVATIKVDPYIAIYRSVGPSNTTALATGTTNAMTISGNDLALATALTNNIGVGDVIQYDSNNSGTVDSLAFIQGRYSSTHYNVVDVDGNLPTETIASDTDWDIFRAYISLFNAEYGTENTGIIVSLRNFGTWTNGKDLVAANQQWNIALYADAADTASVGILGWTTSNTNYVKIYAPYSISEVGVSQRHDGVWDNTKSRIETAGTSLLIYSRHAVFEGLQVYASGNTAIRVIGSGVLRADILNNIVRGSSVDWTAGIYVSGAGPGAVVNIRNNIVYDLTPASGGHCIYALSSNPTYYIYNNTTHNCNVGLYKPGVSTADVILKNNIAQNCTNGYDGSFHGDSDYNISDIASDAPNATFGSGEGTVVFADEAGDDFHLAVGDAAARDLGVDLSSSFSDDIDGETRSGTWDIGADEYQ